MLLANGTNSNSDFTGEMLRSESVVHGLAYVWIFALHISVFFHVQIRWTLPHIESDRMRL